MYRETATAPNFSGRSNNCCSTLRIQSFLGLVAVTLASPHNAAMTILEEYDPLATVDADYGAAVLRLAWDLNRKTKARTLLCAALELLPHEVPPPLDLPERTTVLSNGHRLYSTDRVLSLRQGLDWFELARAGRVLRPDPDGTLGLPRDDSPTFTDTPRGEVPRAPLLALASRAVPFVADWQLPPRVRSLIPTAFSADGLWENREREAALAWLRADLQFDFQMFPEYWGSIHFVAPNPVFRRIHGSIDRASGRPEFTVAVELRAGKRPAELHYELESMGPTGTVFLSKVRLATPITRFFLPGEPEMLSERVFEERRGLLYELRSFALMADVGTSVTLNMASEVRNVSSTLPDGTAADYSVTLKGRSIEAIQIGAARETGGATARLREAAMTRERRTSGEARQRWFRDQVRDATEELRKIVRRASRQVWVADPYFQGDDLHRVLLAVTDPEIPVRVLAGAEHLQQARAKVENCETLQLRIDEAHAAGRMNPLTVRIMRGTPALHDRFLRIDDELWMLGSSLNSFGGRGTMLLRVPDPDPVLNDLEQIWADSQDFGEWLSERRKARPQ